MPDSVEILILEDSKAQAEMLGRILARRGYSVVSAKNGVDGLGTLAKSKPDLIISDVEMPELDGYGFCRQIKGNERLADVPIILLTSLSEPKDIVKGLNAGADYYLTKPYSESLLLSMVESIIASGRDKPAPPIAGTVKVISRGRTERITAKPSQIANFLFSTYENLLAHNEELVRTRRELRSMNELLEEKVREKTLSLEEEVAERKKAHETLQRTLDGTVVALARAVEMRDPYTAGHQMRVSELSSAIARHLDFTDERVEGIRVMGLLHDIGKITIPAEILTKPSKLSAHEFLFIKTHSQAGYDILKEIEFPWPVATAVLQHHERINGTGYPLGLRDPEIMMEAKILAVADVAESMSSHRPYRPALGIDTALSEIAINKGVLYSAEAADALAEIFRHDGTVLGVE
jgi:putative nucleotidyltransferase with HDIG domain